MSHSHRLPGHSVQSDVEHEDFQNCFQSRFLEIKDEGIIRSTGLCGKNLEQSWLVRNHSNIIPRTVWLTDCLMSDTSDFIYLELVIKLSSEKNF